MKTYSKLLLAFLFLILVVSPVVADEPPENGKKVTVWSDSSGKFKIEASFVDLVDGNLVLLKRISDGKIIKVPLNKLDEESKSQAARLHSVASDTEVAESKQDNDQAVDPAVEKPPKNGPYVKYYENGQIKIRANYRNGKRNGKFEERFNDGKYKIRANYRAGQLNGRYQEYASANGSVRLLKTANYRDGKLHGEYKEFNGDDLRLHQFFSNGNLLLPKSRRQIEGTLSQIAQLPISIGNIINGYGYPKILRNVMDSKQQGTCKDEVRLLMRYRYLCDVPYKGLSVDYSMLVEATAAADISQILGDITHTPSNPGMSAAEFAVAKKGCAKSNLAKMTDTLKSVHLYMGDSDEKNIDRVGHRRWCLNPKMLKTGFGAMGRFSAMCALDHSRMDVPDYDIVAYPPRGYMPIAYFGRGHAWSVQPNPAKYKFNEKSVKVDVFSAQLSMQSGNVRTDSQPLPLNHFSVSMEKIGVGPAIIFRPTNMRISKNSTYAVMVKGIKTLVGEDYPLNYIVTFY